MRMILTHWGRVMNTCVSELGHYVITGSDNDLATKWLKASDLENLAIHISYHQGSFVDFREQNKPAYQVSIYLLRDTQMNVYHIPEDLRKYVW